MEAQGFFAQRVRKARRLRATCFGRGARSHNLRQKQSVVPRDAA